MRTLTGNNIGKAAKEVYRSVLLGIFKLVIFIPTVAGWLIGLIRKRSR